MVGRAVYMCIFEENKFSMLLFSLIWILLLYLGKFYLLTNIGNTIKQVKDEYLTE